MENEKKGCVCRFDNPSIFKISCECLGFECRRDYAADMNGLSEHLEECISIQPEFF